METSLFPLIKRFKDLKTSLILVEEEVFHEKAFRAGTIFTVVGWREIEKKAYLVLNKGSWEGLVEFEKYQEKLKKLK